MKVIKPNKDINNPLFPKINIKRLLTGDIVEGGEIGLIGVVVVTGGGAAGLPDAVDVGFDGVTGGGVSGGEIGLGGVILTGVGEVGLPDAVDVGFDGESLPLVASPILIDC